jgi:hypothetical protein
VCPDIENHHVRSQKTLDKEPLTLFKVSSENCIAANVVLRQPPPSVRKMHEHWHRWKQKIPDALKTEPDAV